MQEGVQSDQAEPVRPLPTGTVTMFFSDIERSTELLHALGDRYQRMLELHRSLLRTAFSAHGGREVDTQGDAFFVAFARARDAIAAASAAQLAVSRHFSDDEQPLRVRIGLHTGEPTMTGTGYVGLDVHRAARICGVGHGGQVLLSQTTRNLLEAGVAVRDLGEHRLKDLGEPQRLFQLLGEGLERDFPPLNTLENRPTNLPAQPTPLIGRDREIRVVTELLRRDDVRLVTLTGPGGSGKTRLALHAAAELLEDFPDGAYFVPLAVVTDPQRVASSIAESLRVRDLPGHTILETLRVRLHGQELLLVVDNFEHLLDAGPLLVALLAAAPTLKLLTTSRARLNVSGEHVYPVPPLELPESSSTAELEALGRYESVALFVARARAAKPDFALTAENAKPIAELCLRLDGLPLAIELAAARVAMLPPSTLATRLDRRLELLASGPRDLPERQRTLRKTIDWSFDLLDPSEQRLLARLSVFVGGCTLDAVETVCATQPASKSLDWLTSLVDGSLIRQEERGGEPRYSMLETIREYATEQLEASGAADETRRRSCDYFVALVERTDGELPVEKRARWLTLVEREHDNLRACLAWCLDRDEKELSLRLAATLGWFWLIRGRHSEGSSWVERAPLGQDVGTPQVVASALVAAGALAMARADYDAAATHVSRALELRPKLPQPPDAGVSRLEILGMFEEDNARDALAQNLGGRRLNDLAAAYRAIDEFMNVARSLGSWSGEGVSQALLGANRLDLDDASKTVE